MFSGEIGDRQVAAGKPGEPGISDAVTFYAKSKYVLHNPDGTTTLELTNKRARFVLPLPLGVADSISARDVVVITASPSSLAVTEVVVIHNDSKGRFVERKTVWDSAEDGAISLKEVTYWKKSASVKMEKPQL